MNELLQKHGCSNVFSIPDGLKELMCDISREVLREQPTKIFDFIANYLSALIITREHGIMAVKILEDLCDCRPSASQHLLQLGFGEEQAQALAEIIKEEIEGFEPADGKDKIKEYEIVKRILKKMQLDEPMTAKVCQVARNAFRDYWFRKKALEKSLKRHPDQPWEIAAQHTLEIYKKTKPSFEELSRAAEKIQAAYKGYYVRRNLLQHLKPKPKPKKRGPKLNLPGPPLDIAGARQIEYGPIVNVKVQEDNVQAMFEELSTQPPALPFDPRQPLTYVPKPEDLNDSFVSQNAHVSMPETLEEKKRPNEIPRRRDIISKQFQIAESLETITYEDTMVDHPDEKKDQIYTPVGDINEGKGETLKKVSEMEETLKDENEEEAVIKDGVTEEALQEDSVTEEVLKEVEVTEEELENKTIIEEAVADFDEENSVTSVSEAMGEASMNTTASINEEISEGEIDELEDDEIVGEIEDEAD